MKKTLHEKGLDMIFDKVKKSQEDKQKIVGHKTMIDGSHQPLYENEPKLIWDKCSELKAKRAADMPTEKEALQIMGQAHERLRELGFKTAYGADNNKQYDVIEAGSTGIHTATYEGKWPTGSWWIHDGETWPSRPILYREKPIAAMQKAEPRSITHQEVSKIYQKGENQ